MPASSSNVTVLGRVNFRGDSRVFGIKQTDRRQHCYLLGKSGTGKTTTLTQMILQDLERGAGLAIVDPHGDLAEFVLDSIPSHRINDVVYFDPSDTDFPIAFNVLETLSPQDANFTRAKTLVASGLVGVFKKLWSDSWGPRLEYILRNAILALLETPGNTLLAVPRLFTDEAFRARIVSRVQDPVVRLFWEEEFPAYDRGFQAEATSPIQNKVGQFLSTSLIRNIVGQPRSTLDLEDILESGKILILNLAKGKIGEDNAALLGSMMITKLQLAAMARAHQAEEERRDFALFVDEFQTFATDSFADILSESRKYRLSLTLAHQYISQMPPVLRDAVFGNIGTLVSFRVGATDAAFLEHELTPRATAADLVGLPNHEAYIKLTLDGAQTAPFSMTTIPLPRPDRSSRETILRVCRERYGRHRDQVEDRVSRWMSRAHAAV